MEHLQTIQQIFTARFLQVPDYQRGYAWEAKHWDDLLADLELLEVGSEHYTGTLVLHNVDEKQKIMDEGGHDHGVYDIVDGQQRITTIVLLLDSIRRALDDKSPLAEGIRKTYIITRDGQGQARAKLRLNRDTHQFFESTVLADVPGIQGPQIRSQKLLRDAQAHIQEYLRTSAAKQDDSKKWLVDLYRKITNGLMLTVYEVPRASEVGVIFEVMNNRGKQLSDMEKVKNYLLYLTSKIKLNSAEQLADSVNDAWRSIFEGLMAAGASSSPQEDRLLRAHWLAIYDYQPRRWAGVDSIKERFGLKRFVGKHKQLVDELEQYVSSLRQFAVAYCDFISPARTEAFAEYGSLPARQKSLRRVAEKLVRLEAQAAFLPLLGVVRLKAPGDGELLDRFLGLCERYAFRVYRLAMRRANAGQTTLFKAAYELFHGTIDAEHALARLAATLLVYAPEAEFGNQLEVSRNWYEWHGLKYFLYEYEEYLARGHALQLPWDVLVKTDKKDTIEHIFPRAHTDPYWKERWTEDDARQLLNDVGNLALTYDNSSYQNYDFIRKRGGPGHGACYANSNIFMERKLAEFSNWTPVECRERRRQVIGWARERWSVAPPAEEVASAELLEDEENGE